MFYLIGIFLSALLLLIHLNHTDADFKFIIFCLGLIIFFYIKYNRNKIDNQKLNTLNQTSKEEDNITSENNYLKAHYNKAKSYEESVRLRNKAKSEESERIRKLKLINKFKKLDIEDKKKQNKENKLLKKNINTNKKVSIKKAKTNKKNILKTKEEDIYVAIDFETANNSKSSACEIGYALFTRKKIIDSDSFLIRPPTKSFYFTDIHNITWEDVENEPTFDEIWPVVYSNSRMKSVKFIAAHNASFDRNVLEACCNYYSINVPRKKFICTYRNISSKIWSFENNKLSTVCRNLKIPLDHHKGKSDAEACAKIVIKAFKEGWEYI